MRPKNNIKNILIVVVVGTFFVALAALLILGLGGIRNPSYIDIGVTPSDSRILLDNKGGKVGLNKVRPGQHTVTISRAGFSTQSRTMASISKQTTYAGFILEPNSPETTNWYKQHPEDQKLIESITGKELDQKSSVVSKKTPIILNLPYIGPGLDYRIDYGQPSSKSTLGGAGIYIRYRTEKDKQSALEWIKNQGADPSKLDIIYVQGNF